MHDIIIVFNSIQQFTLINFLTGYQIMCVEVDSAVGSILNGC